MKGKIIFKSRIRREEGGGSGNWDCIGEISGAPVPSWQENPSHLF